MENRRIKTLPHPHLSELLFAYKSKTSAIFNDVLGIHNIHHIAVTRIDPMQNILIYSSTPAMEYNLFSSTLWRFDNTYDPEWFHLCKKASWESLYCPKRYDELYFIRQIKHGFSTGLSIPVFQDPIHYIYSMAGRSSTLEDFESHIDDFYKIGKYCSNLLAPLFEETAPTGG